MIIATGLYKRFGVVTVLRDFSLHAARGRVTAVVGPNGAGKTTFIKSVLGLTRPDRGTVRFDGVPIGDDVSYRERIGYMPQIAHFPENLTGAELLALLRDLRNGSPADEELVAEFELGPALGKPLRVLSGGTRQKVNAAAAFLFSPDLYILDEPTAGLDPVASGILKQRILRERAAGRAVILTSHIMSEIEELADDVAFVVEGRVRVAATPAELKRTTGQQNLERAIAVLMLREAAA